MKYCKDCKEEKEEKEFYIQKNKYLNTYCKKCIKLQRQTPEYVEKRKLVWAKYAKNNREKLLNRYKSEEGRKIKAKLARIRRSKNPDLAREKGRAYYRIRYPKRKNDPSFYLPIYLRNTLNKAIQRNSKQSSALTLLGCSIEELKKYLESKFQEGMSWCNHSSSGWHIDHIQPLASFDLSDVEQQKQAFHYTNLQPLWAKDNLIKGSKTT